MASREPSLADAFGILDAAGQFKLEHLKHKTLCLDRQRADLLHAMVLLKLGQETEARISLDALKADPVAQFVARQWAGVDGAEASEEPSDMSWATAQVYHLLVEENLCPALMRDKAYQAALRDFRSRNDHRLGELQEEARAHCGWHSLRDPAGFQTLRSDLNYSPLSSEHPSRARSLPQPIEDPSGGSLRSTGSLASVASALAISQSPTMPFLSQPHSAPGPSKLCLEPRPSSVPWPGCRQPEEMSWPPTAEPAGPQPLPPLSPVLPGGASEASAARAQRPAPPGGPQGPAPSEDLETTAHYSVECTEEPVAPKPLPSPSGSASSFRDPTPPQLPAEDTTVHTARPGPPPASDSPQAPPCPPPSGPSAHPSSSSPHPAPSPGGPSPGGPSPGDSLGQKFYNFVVLHARADEHVAVRVRERLEGLGVADGATFCEEFQQPGRGELRCLQDALDHSAFTVLLLTPNARSPLSHYQVNHSMMTSLGQHGRQDTVIPFLPREYSLDQLSPEDVSMLRSIVWLEEQSPVFARRVANTFRADRLRAIKDRWREAQHARAVREQQQLLEQQRHHLDTLGTIYSAYGQSQRAYQAQVEQLQAALANLAPGFGAQVPLAAPPPFPAWPDHQLNQAPFCPPGMPAPAFQAPPASPVPLSPAPLIIHHAQMVQVGHNNHMLGQRGSPVPENNAREAE